MARILIGFLLAGALAGVAWDAQADGRPAAGPVMASSISGLSRPPAAPPPATTPLQAHTIDAVEITALIQRSAARAGHRNLQVELAPGRYTLTLPDGAARRVDVEDLWIDTRQGRFSARLVAAAGDPRATRFDVTGRAFEMVAVPVLLRDARPGTPIRPEDLEWQESDASRLGRDVLRETADLVGRAPRRPLKAGQAIRAGDLADANLVAKGEPVAMIVASRGMQLTAIGQALEPGDKGATIRVRNAHSNRIVEGVVTGPGTVSVALGSSPLRAEKRSR